MGHHSHHILKCNYCKRRKSLGGSKKSGKWAVGENAGWVHVWDRPRDAVIWLCPTCARKRGASRG